MKLLTVLGLLSVMATASAQAATKEEVAVCDEVYEVAFAVQNGRQSRVDKSVFLDHPSTTPQAAAIINRAWKVDEVPVYEIAYTVRDFAKAEKKSCLVKLSS